MAPFATVPFLYPNIWSLVKRSVAALGLACLNGAAIAEDAAVLEQIVVTAHPTGPDEPPDVAPRLVYEADELARFGALTVGELIRRLPGVSFASEAGQFESPQLRGIGPEYTQVLIDGRRVPGLAEDRSAAVDRIPADLIERVEIVRSPTADLDAQGIGGSLNVILRSGAAVEGSRLRAGSVVSEEGKPRALAHISHGLGGDPWSAYGSLSLQPIYEVRGYRERVQSADQALIEDRRGEETRYGRSVAGDARGTYRILGDGSVSFDAQYLHTQRDTRFGQQVTDSDVEAAPLRFDEQEAERQATKGLGLRTALPVAEDIRCLGGVDHTAVVARRTASAEQTQAGAVGELLEDETLKIRDRESRLDTRCTLSNLVGERLRMGAAVGRQNRQARDQRREFDAGEPLDVSPYGGDYRIEERRTDLFVQSLWALAPDLELDAGMRLEVTRRDQAAASASGDGRNTSDVDWLPNIHLRWSLDDDAQVRASLARTLRRPDFAQLVPFQRRMNGIATTGNPSLSSESAFGADLGYQRSWAEQRVSFDANLFHRDFQRLIEQVRVSPDRRRPENIGSGRAWGLELESGIQLDPVLGGDIHLGANLALLNSSVRDPDTGRTRRFQRQSPYVINLKFEQTFNEPDIAWGLALTRQAPTREWASDSVERSRYGGAAEAYVSIQFSPGYDLRISGRNLLDAQTNKTTRSFEGTRDAGLLNTISRERESLGPSFLVSFEAAFR